MLSTLKEVHGHTLMSSWSSRYKTWNAVAKPYMVMSMKSRNHLHWPTTTEIVSRNADFVARNTL